MRLLIIVLLIIGYLPCQGQSIITDRPDQTESSSTVDKQSLQIESGVLLGFTEINSFHVRQLLAPTTLFRLGLTSGVELRVLSQFETIGNQFNSRVAEGISDLEIGTKIQILRNPSVNTEIAFLSHLIIPTGSSELSLDRYGTINKLCILHRLNAFTGMGYNIGYNYFGVGKGDLTYSLALGFSINDKVSVYIEPYGDLAEFDKHFANFDAGFTYLLSENTQFDFSFGTGINYTMNYLSIGISTQFTKRDQE